MLLVLTNKTGILKLIPLINLGTVFNSEDSTRAQANLMASWLNDAGINTNLAPVVDVNVNPTSPAIGRWGRSFSSDPMRVAQHSFWTIDEYENAGIITSLKHFPGSWLSFNRFTFRFYRCNSYLVRFGIDPLSRINIGRIR